MTNTVGDVISFSEKNGYIAELLARNQAVREGIATKESFGTIFMIDSDRGTDPQERKLFI